MAAQKLYMLKFACISKPYSLANRYSRTAPYRQLSMASSLSGAGMNKMLLCAEMHAVAKIANLAKIHQRVGKNSNVTLAGATSKVAN